VISKGRREARVDQAANRPDDILQDDILQKVSSPCPVSRVAGSNNFIGHKGLSDCSLRPANCIVADGLVRAQQQPRVGFATLIRN